VAAVDTASEPASDAVDAARGHESSSESAALEHTTRSHEVTPSSAEVTPSSPYAAAAWATWFVVLVAFAVVAGMLWHSMVRSSAARRGLQRVRTTETEAEEVEDAYEESETALVVAPSRAMTTY
jgi:hypothetical protein